MVANTYVEIRKAYSELVRACLQMRDPVCLWDNESIPKLIEFAIEGHITYPIASSLIKLDIDSEYKKRLSDILKKSTFMTFVQSSSCKEISAEFEKAGIRHQLLKGSVMKTIYPSMKMREMSDIDLVVYDESLDEASKVLEKLGYTVVELVKHHMVFSKDPGIVVEAHWCLYDENVDHSQHMYFNNMRGRLKEGCKYTYEFSKEDFYIYMIAHMAKHFFEKGCGIRNLMDIYVYLEKYKNELDYKYIETELTKCGLLDFEKHMKELAYIWLEDRQCSDFYENLFAYMLDSGIYGRGENGIWSQLAKETTDNDNVRLHFYFPSYKFMVEKYGWLKKAPVLLPLAWVLRGVTGVASKQARDHRDNLNSTSKEDTAKLLDIYHRLNLNFRR